MKQELLQKRLRRVGAGLSLIALSGLIYMHPQLAQAHEIESDTAATREVRDASANSTTNTEMSPTDRSENPQEISVSFYGYPNNLNHDVRIGSSLGEELTFKAKKSYTTTVPAGTLLKDAPVALVMTDGSLLEGFSSQATGGDLLPGDTELKDGMKLYAQLKQLTTKITAVAGAHGSFEDGSKYKEVTDERQKPGYYARLSLNPGEDTDKRIMYKTPLPTADEGWKLKGFTYEITSTRWKQTKPVKNSYSVEVLFSNPKYKNRAHHGLGPEESVVISYLYERDDLPLGLIFKDEDGKRLAVEGVTLSKTDGTAIPGSLNAAHQWKSEQKLKPGSYKLSLNSLPEDFESIQVDPELLNNVVISSIAQDPKSFNLEIQKADETYPLSSYFAGFILQSKPKDPTANESKDPITHEPKDPIDTSNKDPEKSLSTSESLSGTPEAIAAESKVTAEQRTPSSLSATLPKTGENSQVSIAALIAEAGSISLLTAIVLKRKERKA